MSAADQLSGISVGAISEYGLLGGLLDPAASPSITDFVDDNDVAWDPAGLGYIWNPQVPGGGSCP